MAERIDLNTNAFRIVKSLTGENKEDPRVTTARSAGRVGGRARANKLTAGQRRDIAIKANAARWRRTA